MGSLESISGVGPKTISLLNKIGIYEIDDLVNYYPFKYNVINRSNMNEVDINDKVIIDGVVDGQPTILHISKKLKKINFRVANEYGLYNVSVFNQVYLYKQLKYGMNVILFGKYDKLKNTIVANEVRFGKLPNYEVIEPVYRTTNGLSKKVLSKFIYNALRMNYNYVDYIPEYLVNKYNFCSKDIAIKNIHMPKDIISFRKARQRIKYEEIFLYLLKINYLKYINNSEKGAIVRNFDDNLVKEFICDLDFELTLDQVDTIDVIKKELKSNKRMNRLIQGDVGSGKTIVSMIASYINYLSGYQTALMAPTEILAKQHYYDSLKLFQKYGLKVCLITSNISRKEKNKIYNDIALGSVDLIIGTQALIQDNLVYNNLGLIITDEQHRFGVKQREKLKNKGIFPDVLSMTATPIPRTYALTLYGDMDISYIKTKPSNRKDVITYFKKTNEIRDVLDLMKQEIDKKHQIYVIAPSIDGEDEDNSLESVILLKEKMNKAFGKISRVECIHGKMNIDEKNRIMKDFENGSVNILVSTTVVEVGVNVLNASMIVIFNANYFGLSTLHQLRGRVGRSDIQSYCVLVADDDNERLNILVKCNDGFRISEYDFKNRGEGDLFGIKQSGEALFKIANIKNDIEMVLKVKNDVDEFINYLLNDCKYKYLLDYLDESCFDVTG